MKLVALVLVMHGHSEDGRLRQQSPIRLVDLSDPFVFGEARRHVVDVLDSYRGRPGTLETSSIHRHNLYRIVGGLLAIEAADGGFDDSGFFLDFEDGSSGVFIYGKLRIGTEHLSNFEKPRGRILR